MSTDGYTLASGGHDTFVCLWDVREPPAGRTHLLHTLLDHDYALYHLAFRADDLADLEGRKQRWLDHGHSVHEIDHGWCRSIYTVDPNGILVEFCTTTQAMTAADREEARRLLKHPNPPLETPPEVIVHHPKKRAAAS